MAYRISAIRLVSALGALALLGCGSSDDASFDTDGGAGSSAAGTGGSGSGGSAGSGAAGSGGAAGAASVECNGSHPIDKDGERVCPVGHCRCQASDTCFPSEQAARCCEGEIRCFTTDGSVDCKGTHPVVTNDGRSCESGSCYCEARDACFASAIAALCCAQPPVCP